MTDPRPMPYTDPDRVTAFLRLVAEGDASRALAECPFTWTAARRPPAEPEGFRVAIRVRPAFMGQEIWAETSGPVLINVLRAVVLNIPDLATRYAKVEAMVAAEREDRRTVPTAPVLEPHHVNFLASLARAEQRKRVRALNRLAPHPDQSNNAFVTARLKMERKLDLIDDTLQVLRAMGAQPVPFLPERGSEDE